MASKKSYTRLMRLALRPGAVERFRGEATQADLAARAGVSRATINRIERGHAESVTFDTVNKIAAALGVDADMLVTFDRDAS